MEETGNRDAHEPESPSRGVFRWFVVVAVLLVVYPLSSGPVMKLVEKGLVPPGAGFLYVPLLVLHDHSTVGKRCLEWYLEDVWNIK